MSAWGNRADPRRRYGSLPKLQTFKPRVANPQIEAPFNPEPETTILKPNSLVSQRRSVEALEFQIFKNPLPPGGNLSRKGKRILWKGFGRFTGALRL